MKSKYSDIEAKKYISKFAKRSVSKDLALRIYTTQLLGNDPTVVLHGGGNTSVKSSIKTMLGNLEEIIYVKGSGKDMGNIEEDGFPALEMKNLLNISTNCAKQSIYYKIEKNILFKMIIKIPFIYYLLSLLEKTILKYDSLKIMYFPFIYNFVRLVSYSKGYLDRNKVELSKINKGWYE